MRQGIQRLDSSRYKQDSREAPSRSPWKRLIGVEGHTWFIASHSHVPGIDFDSKVTNTGSWLKSAILSPERGTGVIVGVEGVKLVRAKS